MSKEAIHAPGELELVRDFVNTYDAELDDDSLSTPTALSAWLAEKSLAESGPVSQAELDGVIEAREALRSLLLANNKGEAPSLAEIERLNDAFAGRTLEVQFGGEGGAALVPGKSGVDGALAKIAAIAREAMGAGEWQRLKVCPADDCLWAFYDRSRNRSRTWCKMEVCGNRAKVRKFRERD